MFAAICANCLSDERCRGDSDETVPQALFQPVALGASRVRSRHSVASRTSVDGPSRGCRDRRSVVELQTHLTERRCSRCRWRVFGVKLSFAPKEDATPCALCAPARVVRPTASLGRHQGCGA